MKRSLADPRESWLPSPCSTLALGIGVTRIVLDLYLAYPITGPPWLMTMVNRTGIAWLLPIVLLLSALVTFTLFLVLIYLIGQGKELGQDLLSGALVNRHSPFPFGHTASEIPGGSSDFRDVRSSCNTYCKSLPWSCFFRMNRAAGSGNRLIRPNPRIPPDSSLDSVFGFRFLAESCQLLPIFPQSPLLPARIPGGYFPRWPGPPPPG